MKKVRIILSFTLAALLSAIASAKAEETGSQTGRVGALLDPVEEFAHPAWGYWEQRVGISEFPFLKIGQSARAEAMGGAYTAIADDINSAFWNPAGLAHIERAAYTVNYVRWLANSKLFSGALAFNAGFGVIGFSVVSFAAEEFEITTPTAPQGAGTFAKTGDIAIGAIFAKRITDKLLLGGQVRWMQEDLYLDKISNLDYSIGTLFYTGFKSSRLAMGFQNLGPNVKVIEGGFTSQMPITFSIGAAMEIMGEKGGPTYSTLSAEYQIITDYRPVTRLGIEAWLRNMLALRAGYRMGLELEDWSLGAGLKHELVPGKIVTVDVSYHHEKVGIFSSPLRISVGGTF